MLLKTPYNTEDNSGCISLARKYRPLTFDGIIGQKIVVETLKNEISTMRIPQALLFTGIRGIGKTTVARIMAKAMNCTLYPHPSIQFCNVCEQCKSISLASNQDVLEMDAASHTGVDDIRTIIENAKYRPILGRYKIYILDEVHALSSSAFNALLKILEEPPAHLKFIFATTEIRKIPKTVLSRCQRFNLRRVSVQLLRDYYAKIIEHEKCTIEDGALNAIADAADGSVRDGLSIMDQAIALSSDNVITTNTVLDMLGMHHSNKAFELFDSIILNNVHDVLLQLQKMYIDGIDVSILMHDILRIVYSVMKVKSMNTTKSNQQQYVKYAHLAHISQFHGGSELQNQELGEKISSWASILTTELLLNAWSTVIRGLEELNISTQQWPIVEVTMIKLMHMIAINSTHCFMSDTEIESKQEKAVQATQASVQPPNAAYENRNMIHNPKPLLQHTNEQVDDVQHRTKHCHTLNQHSPSQSQEELFGFLPNELLIHTHDIYKIMILFLQILVKKNELMLYHWLLHDIYILGIKHGYMKIRFRKGTDSKKIYQQLKDRIENVTTVKWDIEINNEVSIKEYFTIAELEEIDIEQRKEAALNDEFVQEAVTTISGFRIDKVENSTK